MALPNGLAQISDLGSLLGGLYSGVVDIPKIAVPYTTITNRSQIYDLSKDLGVRMGVNRIPTQQLYSIPSEYGPGGEFVYGVVNDTYNQIRFVGTWTSVYGVAGNLIQNSSTTSSYVEIAFYGTGLNQLVNCYGSAHSYLISIDGAAETALTTPTFSNVLDNRNYSVNQVMSIASGLTLGFHTVRIKANSGSFNWAITGFEILNESSSIKVNSGTIWKSGQKLYNPSQSVFAYNSGFESGVLGSRGGRVVVYQKADNTIAKAVQPTNSSSAFYSAADHSNEEIARVYHWREFGAGRTSDDFGTLGAVARTSLFTLDDGATAQIGDSNTIYDSTAGGVFSNGSSSWISFTFIGTGVDLKYIALSSTVASTYSILVDGVTVQSGITGIAAPRTMKIASGLPYGIHTVRIQCTNLSGAALQISQWIVYQPKKPTIPSDAVELGCYNILADFSANATAGTERVSTGVLRKINVREIVYVNGTGGTLDWTATTDLNAPGGIETRTDRSSAYWEYTFFGTGFDYRFSSASNRTANASVQLQSLSTGGSLLAATTANFPTLSSSTYGTGVTFTSGTLDMNDAASTNGSGLAISNLPLGLWKVRVTNNTASSNLIINALDIITPIHSHKDNGPFVLQNALTVGSQTISDSRVLLSNVNVKNTSQAYGVNTSASTSSTVPIPVPDLSVTHVNKTGRIRVAFNISARQQAGALSTQAVYRLYINGIVQPTLTLVNSIGANGAVASSETQYFNVSPGVHKIDVYWNLSSNSIIAEGIQRSLLVEEA